MKAYFVQHGKAESKDIDAARPLSAQGRQETFRVAEFLKRHEVRLSALFHSGKTRAQQSAEIFAETLLAPAPVAIGGIAPNDDPLVLIESMNQDDAMYIGHLPHIQRVVSQLLCGNPDAGVISWRNSSVACVEISDQGNSLLWFITAEMS